MRLPSKSWVKNGLLNTFEHGFTRVADALVSLLLLWRLAPEVFSKLALAQAVVAPLLLFFIAPESVMYRDFAAWRQEGASMAAARLRAFRLFAWGKAQLALLICLAAALLGQAESMTRFSAMVWAFSLVLAPQLAGPDREFLRLDLQLRALNLLSIYQKATLLGGTLAVILLWNSSLQLLAAVTLFSTVSTALIAQTVVRGLLKSQGAERAYLNGSEGPSVAQTLTHSFKTFSFWQHLSGIIFGWVQTMDLFFLGVLRFPAREVGLYAAVLKVANFSATVPMALGNSFQVWVGRRLKSDSGVQEEWSQLLKFTLLLGVVVSIQSVVLGLLGPWGFSVLGAGKWTADEQAQMVVWFRWILLGATFFYSLMVVSLWLLVRAKPKLILAQIFAPWLVASSVIYGFAAWHDGLMGVAQANVWVSLVYLLLSWKFVRKQKHERQSVA